MSVPLVYGYIRTYSARSELRAICQEDIEIWCAKQGWELGAVFADVGGGLDVEDRVGFRGLLQAVALPRAAAAVILDSGHLSPRDEVVTELVSAVRRAGASLWLRDGELPEAAQRHCRGQSEWSR